MRKTKSKEIRKLAVETFPKTAVPIRSSGGRLAPMTIQAYYRKLKESYARN